MRQFNCTLINISNIIKTNKKWKIIVNNYNSIQRDPSAVTSQSVSGYIYYTIFFLSIIGLIFKAFIHWPFSCLSIYHYLTEMFHWGIKVDDRNTLAASFQIHPRSSGCVSNTLLQCEVSLAIQKCFNIPSGTITLLMEHW